MSFLQRIRDFIGEFAERRHHVEVAVDVEITVEAKRERFRRMTPAEIADTLEAAAADWLDKNNEALDYDHSIVDFMKLTGQDFSLRHRRELADELKWEGSIADTKAMNEFLLPKLRERLTMAV